MARPNALKRSLGLGDAIWLGLGSILGTGVFVSLGLASGITGQAALPALLIAAALAGCNALSSAQLAANTPLSGGTYAYGYKYLTPTFGFIAGTAFLLAKSTSAAAASIGLVSYAALWFGIAHLPINLLAASIILIITLLVATGLRRANMINTFLVSLTLTALIALILTAVLAAPVAPPQTASTPMALPSLFEAAALLFVAFTGYGRIATLGEEVTTPRQTIPRAIIATLILTTCLYLATLLAGWHTLGTQGFSIATETTAAPLQAVATALDQLWLIALIPIAAMAAMAGVIINLILGLSRVAFAMGRRGDLPNQLGQLASSGEPVIAIWLVGLFVGTLAFFGGLSSVWSFSAFTVLIYYALTNLAALRLSASERLYPRAISATGLIACLGLALWISPQIIFIGLTALLLAVLMRAMLSRR